MIEALVVILSFCAGFWLSSQFREKEFEPNNDFIRKLFIRKQRKEPAVGKQSEEATMNDSPYPK